ncbi:MAG: hypothetical protein V2A61_06350, partial [Calditrichota bacterium]
MRKYWILGVWILGGGFIGGCPEPKVDKPSIPPSPTSELVLRDDNLAFYQLRADQFNQLTLQQKRYAHHLYRACLQGRDIYFDQHAPHSLEIRRLLDRLMLKNDSDFKFQHDLRKYALRFWAFNGNYDPKTSPASIVGHWLRE